MGGCLQELNNFPSPYHLIVAPQTHTMRVWALSGAIFYISKQLNLQAMIKTAATAASPTTWGAPRPRRLRVKPLPDRSLSRRGGCASSRFDRVLKVDLITA